MENLSEKELWRVAKHRANFKKSAISYALVNAFLWCIYLINAQHSTYPWPIWVMLGWGIGLAFKYVEAYHSNSFFSTKNEYEKLQRNEH